MSRLDKAEVARAQVGPRELKDPRSKEYAIQTLYALKRYAESLRVDEELVRVEMERVERYRHWEVLGYETKDAMLAAELTDLGQRNVDRVSRLASDTTADDLRERPGQPQKGEEKIGNNITILRRGTEPKYLTARIARDHPDIHERMKAGEYTSVRQAALDAGIIKLQGSFPIHDMHRLAAALKRRLTPEQWTELVRIITG